MLRMILVGDVRLQGNLLFTMPDLEVSQRLRGLLVNFDDCRRRLHLPLVRRYAG